MKWVAESIDADGDGTINYSEFASAVCEPEAEQEEGLFAADIPAAAARNAARQGESTPGRASRRAPPPTDAARGAAVVASPSALRRV